MSLGVFKRPMTHVYRNQIIQRTLDKFYANIYTHDIHDIASSIAAIRETSYLYLWRTKRFTLLHLTRRSDIFSIV